MVISLVLRKTAFIKVILKCTNKQVHNILVPGCSTDWSLIVVQTGHNKHLIDASRTQAYSEPEILELWLANDTSIKTHTWTLLITTPDTLFYSVESLRCLHSLMVILLMSINTWLFNEDILIVNILWMTLTRYTLCG
jgi:hypothetical protein